MDFAIHNYRVRLFKILANSNRIHILQLLLDYKKPIAVGDIADRLQMDQGTLSGHLTRMRENKVVKAKQQGQHMYYSINDPNIAGILRSVKLHGLM